MTQWLMTYAWRRIFPPGNARPDGDTRAAIAVLPLGLPSSSPGSCRARAARPQGGRMTARPALRVGRHIIRPTVGWSSTPSFRWAALDFYPVVWTFLSYRSGRLELPEPLGLPAVWSLSNSGSPGPRPRLGSSSPVGRSRSAGPRSAPYSRPRSRSCSRASSSGASASLGPVLMVGLLVPTSTLMVPLIVFSRVLGIYGTHLAIILVLAVRMIPFSVFLLRSYMESPPRGLEEAVLHRRWCPRGFKRRADHRSAVDPGHANAVDLQLPAGME